MTSDRWLDTDPGRAFLGVPPDSVYAIGCVVVAGARAEFSIREIATSLGIRPGSQKASDLLRRIRRVARTDLPQHARTTPEAVSDWCQQVGAAMDYRHLPAHGASVYKMGQGPGFVHMRTGVFYPLVATDIHDDAVRLADLANEGLNLEQDLMHSPRPGIFLPNYVVDGTWGPAKANTDIGGANLARPTDAEMDQWWIQFGPFPELP